MPALASVSVLIPTKNGERYLTELLVAVKSQKGEVSVVEVIAVDSGSRDRSLDILRRHDVKIIQIPPQEFGHGKTRNLAASYAQGDYLVFLTQDATPANEYWLEKLLSPLLTDPLIAGAYSRHLPRPSCHPMEWRRIVEMELSGRAQSCINVAAGNSEYARNPDVYAFFANVSSAVCRQVWARYPFPDVAFGEDQLWARRVLEAGYKTAYCADSLVYHSHSYGSWDNFGRHFDHAWGLMSKSSGRPREVALKNCLPGAFQIAQADLAFWQRQSGQRKRQVWRQWAISAVSWHLAGSLGLWLGERADILPGWLCSLFSFQERVKRG